MSLPFIPMKYITPLIVLGNCIAPNVMAIFAGFSFLITMRFDK